jgi:hypothetical protein
MKKVKIRINNKEEEFDLEDNYAALVITLKQLNDSLRRLIIK